MRVTKVEQHGAAWSPLVLHPRLTVITGEPVHLAEVVGALGSLYRDAGTAIEGTLEYAGLQMPLDQTAVVSLDLHGSGLCRMDPTSFRGAREAVAESIRAATEHRLRELTDLQTQLEARVGELLRRSEASHAAVRACSEDVQRAAEMEQLLGAELQRARNAPVELDAAIASAESRFGELAARTHAAESRIEELVGVLSPGSDELARLRIGSPGADHATLCSAVQEAEELGLLPEATSRGLRQWLDSVAEGTAPTSESVASMLDEVATLEAAWEELTARGVEGDPAVVEARAHHDEVVSRHEALRGLADSGLLAERARDEIDAAHESADAELEDRVLAAYGFESHLDYTIAVSTRSVGEAVESTLQRAHAEMVRASDALEAERERAAAERSELGALREDLRTRIQGATGTEAESLSAEDLASIPEPSRELDGASVAMQHALQAMRGELAGADEELQHLRDERERLADPAALEAELAGHREHVAALEPLMARATAAADEMDAEIAAIRSELATVAAERSELAESSSASAGEGASSPADLAAFARALLENLDRRGSEPEPVLVEEALVQLGGDAPGVLDAILEVEPDLQVVYVSDQPSTGSWARRARGGELSLVRIGRRRWFGRRFGRSFGGSTGSRERLAADPNTST
ncbi:MAG: hypothetical protein M9942_07825 [Microthrixaceae bacterium]|nr:hypothetical protein [Microthrixaceae bacterium]